MSTLQTNPLALRSQPPAAREDAGVALILALIFLVAIGLTVVALVSMAGTAMVNTANLKSQASLEYAADGAADAAVQWVRFGGEVPNDNCGEGTSQTPQTLCLYLFNDTADSTPGGDPTTPALCLPNGEQSVMVAPTGPSIAVYCLNDTETDTAAPNYSRAVEFYACIAAGCTASNVVSDAILVADVTFNDYCGASAPAPTTTTTTTTCPAGELMHGQYMSIGSWVVQLANS